MKDFFQYIKDDTIQFFKHALLVLLIAAILMLFVHILSPFDHFFRTLALGLLEGFFGIVLIWILYLIIAFFGYRKH